MDSGKLPHGVVRINSYLNQLKPAEKKVAEYVLENPEKVVHLSITNLAAKANVSEATVVKFCQRIGYSGYQELKIRLAQAREGKLKEHIYGEIKPSDNTDDIIKKIFQIYDQSFSSTRKLLQSEKIEKAAEKIRKAKRLYFFGFGASGIVARDSELKFKRLNYVAEALVDNHMQKTVAPLLGENDVVLAISDSGRTRELFNTVKVARNAGAEIIVLTSSMGSPITENADIVLLHSSRETPFRGSALASRMAQLAVIDVLFLKIANAEYDKTIEALDKTRFVMQDSKMN